MNKHKRSIDNNDELEVKIGTLKHVDDTKKLKIDQSDDEKDTIDKWETFRCTACQKIAIEVPILCGKCGNKWCGDCINDKNYDHGPNEDRLCGECREEISDEENAIKINEKQRCSGGECECRLICMKCGHIYS